MLYQSRKKLLGLITLLVLAALGVAACGGAQPETVIVETVVVEKEVETVVEKEVIVVETVEVEKIVEVEAIAEELEPLPFNLMSGKPYDGTEINFLICCPTTPQFIAWETRTAEFTEMTGIEVVFNYGPWGTFQERIVTESIAGTGDLDVFLWLDAWGPAFSQTLLPLEPLLERDGIDYIDDYPPAFIEAGTFNDHLYGLPVRTHAFVMFYRQDVFDDLGLSVPTTWAEVVEAGLVIQENTDLAGMANYYGVSSAQNLFTWALMLWGEDGDIFDENYRPIFNSAAGVSATDRYMTMRAIGQEGQFTHDEATARATVVDGSSAMIVGWWWFHPLFSNPENAAPEVIDNVAFAPLPAVAGKDPTGFALTLPVGISSFSRNPDASWEFLKWLTHPDNDKAVVLDKSNPETSTVVASHLSTMGDAEVNEANGGLHAAALPGLLNSRILPLIPEWAEVGSILETAISDIALGADTQATLDQAAADVEAVMERANYYKDQ